MAQLFTDPEVRRYLGGPRDNARAQASALDLIAIDRELPAWVVMQPGSQVPVGFVSLDNHHDGEDVEVSFVLTPQAQGLGLARAAVAEALEEIWRLGFGRVVAETQSANVRSIRLLEGLGFTALRQVSRYNADQTLFSLWRPSSNAA